MTSDKKGVNFEIKMKVVKITIPSGGLRPDPVVGVTAQPS